MIHGGESRRCKRVSTELVWYKYNVIGGSVSMRRRASVSNQRRSGGRGRATDTQHDPEGVSDAS